MKRVTFLSLLIFLLTACDSNSTLKNLQNYSNLTPLEVVNKRMDYYNNHNYDEFIKLYHTNVAIYTYPDKLLGEGADRLASIFKESFENKSISVNIVNQMDNGPYVINHEIVTKEGKVTKYISIYKVEKGIIRSVSFVREF